MTAFTEHHSADVETFKGMGKDGQSRNWWQRTSVFQVRSEEEFATCSCELAISPALRLPVARACAL